MTQRQEKKIAKLTENINLFISKMDECHKTAIEKGKNALDNNQKTLVDFWVTQYKLTDEYKKQALEMLGQLDIARYSNEMQIAAGTFFNNMGKMAKALSRIFGYTAINSVTKDFEKQSIKISLAREKTNEMIEDATDRFKDIQESFSQGNEALGDIQISDTEKNQIIAEFQKGNNKQKNFNDLFKSLI